MGCLGGCSAGPPQELLRQLAELSPQSCTSRVGGGGDWRGPPPRPHRVLPAAAPPVGLRAYCSRPPSLGGHRGNPTDACKVSLAPRAARTQAPRWRCGQRCRGPPGDLSATIPTLPALAPGGDTLTLRMLLAAPGGRGAEGTRRREHQGRPRSGRAGLAGLRGDSGCGGRDCVSNRSHSSLLAFGSRLSLEFSSDPGRSRCPVPRGSGAQREKVPAKRGAGAGAECARE